MKRILVFTGLALAGWFVWQGVLWDQRRIGALNERIHARETVIAALARQKAHVDTVWLKGKTVYADAVQGWDSIKVTLGDKAKIDPVVIAGDKLAQSCTTLVALCEQRNWISDSLIRTYRVQVADLQKRPGFLTRSVGKLGWLGAGVVAGVILTK